jgi:asparagine synthetase B (glutamine-hydrolysing)
MDWLFKNKARRYISADYGLSSTKVDLRYPFDDHRLIDLALGMPAEQLLKQNVYLSAMMEHAFVGGMRELANMPFEMAELRPYGEGSYQLLSTPRPLLNRILNKVKARPDHRQSYPIAKYVHEQWGSFERQFERVLEASPSQLIDHEELRKLVKEMRTKDLYFFHKPLSSILSLMRMEQRIKA